MKNIFVENPKTGKGDEGSISTGDFWNLIGRAGRLSHEFSGNVYCLFTKAWDVKELLKDKFVPIESAYQAAVYKDTKQLAFYARNPPESPERGPTWAVQALASIYADRVVTNAPLGETVQGPDIDGSINEIDTEISRIRTNQRLPDEVHERNFYVHPSRLEELGEFLRNELNILNWLPLNPFRDNKGFRLRQIFQLLEKILIRHGNEEYKYYAYLATAWMRGDSIRKLLADRINFLGLTENEEIVNEHARELFKEIEQSIRYVYVKYMGVYAQVLAAVLLEKGFDEQAKKLQPIHLFLEFGASNKTLINLMSLGVSRTSALLLKNAASLPDELDADECRRFIESLVLERSSLPSICKAEIRRIRLSS